MNGGDGVSSEKVLTNKQTIPKIKSSVAREAIVTTYIEFKRCDIKVLQNVYKSFALLSDNVSFIRKRVQGNPVYRVI